MATVVSAPGKVLVAGGYLVLDPAYSGLVVSTSSRFYTAISPDAPDLSSPIQILVRSPQFLDATWKYTVHFLHSAVQITPDPDQSTNKFVHLALQHTIALAFEVRGADALHTSLARGLDITIVGDNDFYSQRAQLTARRLPPTLAALADLPPFLHTGVRLPDVHKTGLGSSAALITSLVSALLLHLQLIPRNALDPDTPDQSGRRLAHNVAQYIHCLAQGKVGSGFDVAAAVFGSQVYTRFDPAIIEPIMRDTATSSLYSVLTPENPAWNYRVEPFGLPPLTRLMLADVDAGSDTPSLVGKVLAWRRNEPANARALWEALDELNRSLGKTLAQLRALAARDPPAYAKSVKYLSTLQTVQWLANPNMSKSDEEIVEAFVAVHQLSEGIRQKMREMSAAAGVPIEPPEQTELLDACTSGAGVIGGGVPGAGGYDAVWLLVLDPTDCPHAELPSTRVEHVWAKWAKLRVTPLAAVESTTGGARVEQLEHVRGLAALAGR